MAKTTGTEQMGAMTSGRTSAKATSEAEAATKSLSEQALSTGRNISDQAKRVAESSTAKIKEQGADVVGAAKDLASQAADKVKDAVNDQKAASADYVRSLVDAMRRAAGEFDTDLPIAGRYIRKAASQVEGVSDQIRNGDVSDLVRNAQSFARRQPAAFLGMAVLAGFGVVRFLKSSSDERSSSSDTAKTTPRSGATEKGSYAHDFSK